MYMLTVTCTQRGSSNVAEQEREPADESPADPHSEHMDEKLQHSGSLSHAAPESLKMAQAADFQLLHILPVSMLPFGKATGSVPHAKSSITSHMDTPLDSHSGQADMQIPLSRSGSSSSLGGEGMQSGDGQNRTVFRGYTSCPSLLEERTGGSKVLSDPQQGKRIVQGSHSSRAVTCMRECMQWVHECAAELIGDFAFGRHGAAKSGSVAGTLECVDSKLQRLSLQQLGWKVLEA